MDILNESKVPAIAFTIRAVVIITCTVSESALSHGSFTLCRNLLDHGIPCVLSKSPSGCPTMKLYNIFNKEAQHPDLTILSEDNVLMNELSKSDKKQLVEALYNYFHHAFMQCGTPCLYPLTKHVLRGVNTSEIIVYDILFQNQSVFIIFYSMNIQSANAFTPGTRVLLAPYGVPGKISANTSALSLDISFPSFMDVSKRVVIEMDNERVFEYPVELVFPVHSLPPTQEESSKLIFPSLLATQDKTPNGMKMPPSMSNHSQDSPQTPFLFPFKSEPPMPTTLPILLDIASILREADLSAIQMTSDALSRSSSLAPLSLTAEDDQHEALSITDEDFNFFHVESEHDVRHRAPSIKPSDDTFSVSAHFTMATNHTHHQTPLASKVHCETPIENDIQSEPLLNTDTMRLCDDLMKDAKENLDTTTTTQLNTLVNEQVSFSSQPLSLCEMTNEKMKASPVTQGDPSESLSTTQPPLWPKKRRISYSSTSRDDDAISSSAPLHVSHKAYHPIAFQTPWMTSSLTFIPTYTATPSQCIPSSYSAELPAFSSHRVPVDRLQPPCNTVKEEDVKVNVLSLVNGTVGHTASMDKNITADHALITTLKVPPEEVMMMDTLTLDPNQNSLLFSFYDDIMSQRYDFTHRWIRGGVSVAVPSSFITHMWTVFTDMTIQQQSVVLSDLSVDIEWMTDSEGYLAYRDDTQDVILVKDLMHHGSLYPFAGPRDITLPLDSSEAEKEIADRYEILHLGKCVVSRETSIETRPQSLCPFAWYSKAARCRPFVLSEGPLSRNYSFDRSRACSLIQQLHSLYIFYAHDYEMHKVHVMLMDENGEVVVEETLSTGEFVQKTWLLIQDVIVSTLSHWRLVFVAWSTSEMLSDWLPPSLSALHSVISITIILCEQAALLSTEKACMVVLDKMTALADGQRAVHQRGYLAGKRGGLCVSLCDHREGPHGADCVGDADQKVNVFKTILRHLHRFDRLSITSMQMSPEKTSTLPFPFCCFEK